LVLNLPTQLHGRNRNSGIPYSQTDFTEDLKKINVPTLVMHGEDDQIVPYADAAPLSAKLLKHGTLKTTKIFRTVCRWHAGTDINLMGCKSPDPKYPFGDLAGGRVGGASQRLK